MKRSKKNSAIDSDTWKDIYNAYWEKDTNNRYKQNVSSIIVKFGINTTTLAHELRDRKLFKISEKLHPSGARYIVPSRGLSKKYDRKIHPDDEGLVSEWEKNQRKQKIEAAKEKAVEINAVWQHSVAECADDSFTEKEKQFLSLIKDRWDTMFDNDKNLSYRKLSFILECSPDYAEKIYHKLRERGGITGEVEQCGTGIAWHINGVNENLNLPEPKPISKRIPLIRSKPEWELFFILQETYPFVFKEVPAAAFINFDSIKGDLENSERSKCFTLRYDFVCCDYSSSPIFALEYNGKHHWDNPKDALTRRLKRKFCNMVGMDCIMINSIKQLKEFINNMSNIEYESPGYLPKPTAGGMII